MAFSETCRNLTNKFICQRGGCSENNNIQSLEVLIPEVSTAHDSIRSFLSPRLIHSWKHWTMTMMFLCCHARPRRIPEGILVCELRKHLWDCEDADTGIQPVESYAMIHVMM